MLQDICSFLAPKGYMLAVEYTLNLRNVFDLYMYFVMNISEIAALYFKM